MPDDQRRTGVPREEMRGDDPYRPDGTPPGATPEERVAADTDPRASDAGTQPGAPAARDPAADPARTDPNHATNVPSGSAHSAVEAPETRKGRTMLIVAVAAVIGIASAFLLMGEGAEAVDDGAPAVDTE